LEILRRISCRRGRNIREACSPPWTSGIGEIVGFFSSPIQTVDIRPGPLIHSSRGIYAPVQLPFLACKNGRYARCARALDPAKYYNRSAEIWGWMGEWLAAGAEIPDDAEL